MAMAVRLLTLGELPLVRDLSKGIFMYDGVNSQDYLPHYFLGWASSSNHFVYGLFVDGELVASKTDTILDQGKTLYAQGLRVSTKHRGKNYAAKLNALCHSLRQQIHPRFPIKRIRFAKAFHHQNIVPFCHTLEKDGFSILCKRFGITCAVNEILCTKVRNLCTPSIVASISILSPAEAFQFAQKHPKLLQQNACYTDWDVHELTYENFLILYVGGSGTFERRFLSLQSSDGTESFAIYGITPRGHGTALILDIFTESEEIIPEFCHYLLSNISLLRTSLAMKEINHIWIWSPEELKATALMKELYSITKVIPTFYSLHCIYVEKNKPQIITSSKL